MASFAVQYGYTKRFREVQYVKGGTNVEYACLKDSLKSKWTGQTLAMAWAQINEKY
jgi:hypothetical protein